MSLPSTVSHRSDTAVSENAENLDFSTARLPLSAIVFDNDEEHEPVKLLVRNRFDDELSSVSSDGDLPMVPNASCPETAKSLKGARQPQFELAPELSEPQMVEFFSSSGDRISCRGALEPVLGSPLIRNRCSDSSLLPEAQNSPLIRCKTNNSAPTGCQMDSSLPKTVPQTDSPLLKNNPTRFVERPRQGSLCDSDLCRTPSLISSYATTRSTTISTPRTSTCDDSIEGWKQSFDVPIPHMSYKSRRFSTVIDNAWRPCLSRPKLVLHIPDPATGKAADHPENCVAKVDEQNMISPEKRPGSPGKGPETVYDQLKRSLSSGSRSWRDRARRSMDRSITSTISDEREEAIDGTSPI